MDNKNESLNRVSNATVSIHYLQSSSWK